MNYVILSMIIFSIGIYGLLTKRDFIKVIVSVELIAGAASMDFVLLSTEVNKEIGQAFKILALSVDTCVSGVILALLIAIYKKWGTVDVRDISPPKE